MHDINTHENLVALENSVRQLESLVSLLRAEVNLVWACIPSGGDIDIEHTNIVEISKRIATVISYLKTEE